MGLDIRIITDNYEELHELDHSEGYFRNNSLSRTFCNFMSRKNVVRHEPELDQIGKLTGVDISPLYDMENYIEEEELNFYLKGAKTEEERQKISRDASACKEKLSGNIDKISEIITRLIYKLNTINNLPSLLLPPRVDTLTNDVYFSDFKEDKGEGYIGNNFGQDLRNFQRFLAFAKSHGAKTVWFNYS